MISRKNWKAILNAPNATLTAVARVLHSRSHRKDGRFVALSCASLSEDTLEGALFGVELREAPGTATACTANRRGLGVLARHGRE